jgi:hypothetical protein
VSLPPELQYESLKGNNSQVTCMYSVNRCCSNSSAVSYQSPLSFVFRCHGTLYLNFLPFSFALPSFIMFTVTICAARTRRGISNLTFDLISQLVALTGTAISPSVSITFCEYV